MIEEQAMVLRAQDGRVEIQMQRQSACNHCELNQGCGTGAIGRLLGHRSKPLVIDSNLVLKPGDRITLGLPDSSFLKASLLIYGLPLFALVLSSAAGHWFFNGTETEVLLSAIAGFCGGLVISSKLAKQRFSQQFYPRILKINSEPTNQF